MKILGSLKHIFTK